MHKPIPNVLPLRDYPRQKSYRFAVAQIIRELKARHGLTNVELGEIIGVSAETVSNAENENNDLSGVTLTRIWYEFGFEAIQPIADIANRHYEQPQTARDRFNEALRSAQIAFDELEAGA